MRKKDNGKLFDRIGLACGIVLLCVLIVDGAFDALRGPVDMSGEKIPAEAVTLTGTGQGVNGDVVVEVIATPERLYSIRVTEHAETEGIGSLAVDALPGAIYEAQSLAVDGVSGATITSNAIKTAVRAALASGGIDPAVFDPEGVSETSDTTGETDTSDTALISELSIAADDEIPEAAVTLTGTGQGINGDVVVEIIATPERLHSIRVTEQDETVGIGSKAVEILPGKIYETQSLLVDGVTGATITSNAIKDAIRAALVSGNLDASVFEIETQTAPAANTETDSNAPAADEEIPEEAVTLTGTGQGINGDVVVEIIATPERLYSIRVTEQDETVGIGSTAVESLPEKIYRAQSLLVDGVTGATITSNAMKDAIRAALASGNLDASVFEVEPEPDTAAAADVTYDNYDIVVLGAGGAGMTAAIEAADAGCSVIVLESMPMVGGNSVRSTGGLNAAETPYQDENDFAESAGVEKQLEAAKNYADNERITELAEIVSEQWEDYQADPDGYFDSSELFQLDTMIGGGALNDPVLVEKLAEDSNDAIEWLETIGADMPSVSSFGGASVKRIHRPLDENGKVLSVGEFIVPILEKNLKDRGIELLLETTAQEILTDASGAAVGVVAKGSAGNTVTVHAKAVIIATGGFGANHERVEEYRPDLKGFMSTNAAGIQGQGIDMAMAVGADTVDMDQIQTHPTVEYNTASLITEGLRGDGAILVNAEGKRFYDEVSTRDKVSAAEIAQPGSSSWLIVDSRMADASNVIQGYIRKGLTKTGDSYETLAEEIGVDPQTFAETMETWNGYVAEKNDPDFGRTSFANPLDTPPYYAIHVTAGIHHTMGGIRINDAAEALDTDGNVIPGLFAAGEVTGGIHGGNRLGGNAVADFVIFGRIAGTSAAEYAG